MKRIRIKETIDQRYLGAVRFVDNTTRGIVRRPLHIEAQGLRFVISQSHLHVIASAKGLENHLSSFDNPPDQPGVESLEFHLTISDPLQEYLPRTKAIKLPRNPDPESDNSLFQPIKISMFSSATGRLSSNWSIIRASVIDAEKADPEVPIPGALLRIIREDENKLIGSGVTDKRGEVLIVVPGIPTTNFVTEEGQPDDEWLASGDVVEKKTPVNLNVVLPEEIDKKFVWPVNPEKLEEKYDDPPIKFKTQKNGALKTNEKLKLKTGETQKIKLFVKVPDGA